MNDTLCIATDSKNKRTVWTYKGKVMISDSENYELMTNIHEMIREEFVGAGSGDDCDIVEGIKFMINSEGFDIV